jgi:hypothetical protein
MFLVDLRTRGMQIMSNVGGTHSISDYDQRCNLIFDLLAFVLLDVRQVVLSPLYLYYRPQL